MFYMANASQTNGRRFVRATLCIVDDSPPYISPPSALLSTGYDSLACVKFNKATNKNLLCVILGGAGSGALATMTDNFDLRL